MSLPRFKSSPEVVDFAFETIGTIKSFIPSWNSPEDDYKFQNWINQLYLEVEYEKSTPIWQETPGQIRKVMNFNFFNPILSLFEPIRYFVLLGSLLLLIAFWTTDGIQIINKLLSNRKTLYSNIILILPIFIFQD